VTGLLLALLAACGTDVAAPAPEALPARVETWVEADERGMVLFTQVTVPTESSWTLDEPVLEGLRLTPQPERTEAVGPSRVVTRSWSVRGAPGNYVLPPLCLAVGGAAPVCGDTLYLDVGTRPDRSQRADIAEPAATWPELPWALMVGAALAVAIALAGAADLWRRRPRPVAPPIPEEPPHVAAIRRWRAVRDDPTLSNEQKALALSEIFRAYVEVTLSVPARAWSTTETLDHLERLPALARLNVPRARRLLRATDRVKYAEARPGGSFFEELEADLHAFVDATRPRSLAPEPLPTDPASLTGRSP
jgi:hypothetical protein